MLMASPGKPSFIARAFFRSLASSSTRLSSARMLVLTFRNDAKGENEHKSRCGIRWTFNSFFTLRFQSGLENCFQVGHCVRLLFVAERLLELFDQGFLCSWAVSLLLNSTDLGKRLCDKCCCSRLFDKITFFLPFGSENEPLPKITLARNRWPLWKVLPTLHTFYENAPRMKENQKQRHHVNLLQKFIEGQNHQMGSHEAPLKRISAPRKRHENQTLAPEPSEWLAPVLGRSARDLEAPPGPFELEQNTS